MASSSWSAVTDDLTADVADGVMTITVSKPAEANRMTPEALAKLEVVATSLGHRDDVNAVVVTGAGAEHFSTGLLNPKLRASLSKDECENVSA